jgi:hypothetical protein
LRDKDGSLQAHRNSYKTTAILVVGAIWYLFFNPNTTILFIRKSWEGSSQIVQEIKRHYEGKALGYLYKTYFGIDNIKTRNWSNSSITLSTKKQISKEGNIESIGIGGGITGSHYDKVFPDDIITIKDRVSKAEREATKTFIKELRNIPKADGGVIFSTGTPWHKEDGWTLLPEPERYPVGSIEIKGFTPEYLAELRRINGASLYSANYELQHISDELRIFPEPMYAEWPGEVRPCAWVDPAYSGDNTTALGFLGKHDGKWYARGWVWRKHVSDCYKGIIDLLTRYKATTLFVESNADKGYSAKDLSQMWPSVRAINESMNKHIKIVTFAVQHFNKLYFALDIQPEWMNQILDYQEGQEPDDAPDQLASLLRQMGFSGNNILKPASTSLRRLGL